MKVTELAPGLVYWMAPHPEWEPDENWPEDVLCVFNFSHNPVSFTVTAPELAGRPLSDLFGGARFPTFDEEGRATFTLGTQTFFWLKVGDRPVQPATPALPAA